MNTTNDVVHIVDPNEAPLGFYAVPKKSEDGTNICNSCHWRATCNDPATDLLAPGHRCMAVPVRAFDGKVYSRVDGCAVMYKRR